MWLQVQVIQSTWGIFAENERITVNFLVHREINTILDIKVLEKLKFEDP